MASTEETASPAKTTSTAAAAAGATATTVHEQARASPYQEWTGHVQAFYPTSGLHTTAAPAGAAAAFFPASSPFPQPYVWGAQMVRPYGAPIYPPVYFQGTAAYAQPSIAVPAATTAYQTIEPEKCSAAKRPKVDDTVAKGKSGNEEEDEDDSQSESEVSSEARGGSSEPQDQSEARKRNSSQRLSDETSQHAAAAPSNSNTAESSYSGRGPGKLPVSAPGRVMLPAATPNTSMGVDVWPPGERAVMKIHPNTVVVPTIATPSTAAGRNVMPEQWVQDERELKRQRRKQSNRESARRSRLRKQQECDDLARRVDVLSNENNDLRKELEQLNRDCKELASENKSILEELTQLYGPGVLSSLEGINGETTNIQAVDAEAKGRNKHAE